MAATDHNPIDHEITGMVGAADTRVVGGHQPALELAGEALDQGFRRNG